MFDYIRFGISIKDKMQYGDSLRKVSAEIGMSTATLSRAINAKGKLDLETTLKICKWMNTDIRYFITKEGWIDEI